MEAIDQMCLQLGSLGSDCDCQLRPVVLAAFDEASHVSKPGVVSFGPSDPTPDSVEENREREDRHSLSMLGSVPCLKGVHGTSLVSISLPSSSQIRRDLR